MVFVATTCVVIGDTAGKLLTQQGVAPVFIAWTRFALAAALLLPFSGLSLKELPGLADWRVLLRAAFIASGIFLILTALKTEPIANVFGAFFVGPIVSYVLAVIFLGETPSRSRGLLLIVGFAGVLLVVKPGFGATLGMGFAVAAGMCYGAYLAMTRTVAGDYRPRFLLMSQLLVGAVLLAPFGVSAGIPRLDGYLWALILISALGSALGNYLLVSANKIAEASLIAPLVYSQLISATVLGVIVFGDWPDAVALIGLLLVLLSGFGSLVAHRRGNRVKAGR
ncbi:MAG: DMT family transporter [Silicimonas sp.]|nr:DMT family transporter [Silicimonas sp.]